MQKLLRVSGATCILIILTLLVAACGGGTTPTAEPTQPVAVETSPEASATTETIVEPGISPTPETDPAPTEPEAAPTEAEPSATPSPTASPTPTPPPLDEKWYQDGDGNVIPNFVEEELGFDPNLDDCALALCNGEQYDVQAATQAASQPYNLLLILDVSGSMAGDAGGETKLEAAKAVLTRYVETAPEFLNVGLILYGHKGNNTDAGRPESCEGVEVVAALGDLDATRAAEILTPLQPTGWTPIATSLRMSRDVFAGQETANNRVALITDGLETCDGDPVAEVRSLRADGFDIVVDVVGFGVSEGEDAVLRLIAESGGGTYYTAGTRADLDAYFDSYMDQLQEALDQAFALLDCNIDATFDAVSCKNDLVFGAFDVILPLYEGFVDEGNEPAKDEINAIRDSISDWNNNYTDTLTETSATVLQENRQRIEDLRAEIEAANQRRAAGQ